MSSKPGLSCNHSNKSKHDHLPCQERPDIAKIDTVKTPSEKPRQAITVRLDAALVERLRTFCRDQAGKPIYATVNGIVGQAVERELERLDLVLSGALPPDRCRGGQRAEKLHSDLNASSR